ncbi:MAG: M20/M25/M40 family metallo-hydrolase [Planctomycetota bacterium]|nr:M20/M25/M40 family metallo-hydrolase [Planctomycetota bacterium]
MTIPTDIAAAVRNAVNQERLIDTAVQLVGIPSPTRSAADVSNRLAEILQQDGFEVERPEAGYAAAPAVAVRMSSGAIGRTLQFNGHLDTVHLPFVPPAVESGVLTGSGASDMKGGIAAAVEAMRALRDTALLPRGDILLTAHDLHELPWGDGSQVDGLIDAGYVGDAVLLPEYLCQCLPVVGRGLAVLTIRISRDGEPVHEMLGGKQQPDILRAGAAVITEFERLDKELSQKTHPLAGEESYFFGKITGGEIFNQSPTELTLQGTRRWLSESAIDDVRAEFDALLQPIAAARGVRIEGTFQVARDAFEIAADDPFVGAFQSAYASTTGSALPIGAKPFVDDGNTFVRRGGIPAITHGPNATGAHTVNERVPVEELVRVAQVYALTAVAFC